MQQHDFRPFAYIIIILGCLLSFAAAVVPFFNTGYHLYASVLFAGLLPYFLYASFTDVVRGWALLIAGVLILAIHVVVTVPERYLHYDGYTDGVIFYAPLAATVLALVVLVIGARRGQQWCGNQMTAHDADVGGPHTA